MTCSGKIRPLLATARIANVPSVVSNVWAGIAIAAIFRNWEHHGRALWVDALLLMASGVCLYIGGNFLNDWHDREWDARNRPERALPTGLYSPRSYFILALLLGLAGVILSLLVSMKCALTATLIIIFIVIYTRWHKRAVWPVVPMGLCRALLPVMGFLGFAASGQATPLVSGEHHSSLPFVLLHAGALLVYIAGLSLGARYESSPNPSGPALLVSKIALLASGVLAAALWIGLDAKAGGIALLPFMVWMALSLTLYRRPIPVHVSALLAGIPLIDAIAMLAYCLLLSSSLPYPPAGIQSYLYLLLGIPPLAFICGRLLQKLAPAT